VTVEACSRYRGDVVGTEITPIEAWKGIAIAGPKNQSVQSVGACAWEVFGRLNVSVFPCDTGMAPTATRQQYRLWRGDPVKTPSGTSTIA
jgi:hypothetical protein